MAVIMNVLKDKNNALLQMKSLAESKAFENNL